MSQTNNLEELISDVLKNCKGNKDVDWKDSPPKYNKEEDSKEWANPEETFDKTWEKAEKSVEQDLSKATLNIAVIGTVNSGKSSFIKTVTGKDDIMVSPVAGETKQICKYEWPNQKNIYLTDTPGLEDINQLVSAKATDFVESEADVVLYFVNAAVGVTEPVKKAFFNIKSLNKPIVTILTKTDTLTEDDVDIATSDCNNKLCLKSELELVIPVATKKGAEALGITDVVKRVTLVLGTNAKVILWGRMCKQKGPQAESIINWSAGEAFAVGALPIPGSDAVALSGIQLKMIYQLAELYEKEINRVFIKNIILQVGVNNVGKQIFKAAIKGLSWLFGPAGAAAVSAVAAATAGSVTYGLGQTFKKVYMSNVPPSIDELVKSFQERSSEYYTKYNK